MRAHHFRTGPDGIMRCVNDGCGRVWRNTNKQPFGDQHELIAYLRCGDEPESEVGSEKERQTEATCPG